MRQRSLDQCNIDGYILLSGMFLHVLKSYMRNNSRPEGSITKGYIKEECATFCSRYLHNVETKHETYNRKINISCS